MDSGNLRVSEFAELVGYQVSTIRKKIYKREIDSFKVGRLILIPRSEVGRLLKDFRPRIELSPTPSADGGGSNI
ncbi:MAG: excisionase family DNA-binding protein [Nitrospira sp.]|nr:excisionase family DNA-binding protein [Nitrospira sp.]